jgi:hypothetical protein
MRRDLYRHPAPMVAAMSSEPVRRTITIPLNGPGAELSRYLDADGSLLFIGASKSALISFVRHFREAPWRKSIARVTIQRFDDRAEALAAKRHAIATERPAFNRAVGRPRRCAGGRNA